MKVYDYWEKFCLSALFLCSNRIEGSQCLSPSSILIPPCSPLPLLRQLNKDNCSLLATCSVQDLVRVRICFFTDADGRDTAACVSMAAEIGKEGGEEIILKIMLGLVPTSFLFGASAPFSDIFNRDRACVELKAAVSIIALHPAPFSCSKHSTFLFCSSGCFHLKNISDFQKKSCTFPVRRMRCCQRFSIHRQRFFPPSPHQSASSLQPASAFLQKKERSPVCIRLWVKWQAGLSHL